MVARNYLGFHRSGPGGDECADGVIRRLQPDVQMVLEQIAALNLPPLESMTPADARATFGADGRDVPAGPDGG